MATLPLASRHTIYMFRSQWPFMTGDELREKPPITSRKAKILSTHRSPSIIPSIISSFYGWMSDAAGAENVDFGYGCCCSPQDDVGITKPKFPPVGWNPFWPSRNGIPETTHGFDSEFGHSIVFWVERQILPISSCLGTTSVAFRAIYSVGFMTDVSYENCLHFHLGWISGASKFMGMSPKSTGWDRVITCGSLGDVSHRAAYTWRNTPFPSRVGVSRYVRRQQARLFLFLRLIENRLVSFGLS